MRIYISAQSVKRQEIIQELHQKSAVIIEYIMKIMLMPNHSARNHWEGEIAGQLNRIRSIKGSNKYPSDKLLLQCLYYDADDILFNKQRITNDIYNIMDEYNCDYEYDLDSFMNALQSVCFDYFSWLSKRISVNGSIRNQEIYKELASLV